MTTGMSRSCWKEVHIMAYEDALAAALAQMPEDDLTSLGDVSGDIVADGDSRVAWSIECH
jgi:hypothetical protein